MLIELFGDSTDFIERAFYSDDTDGIDASVISVTSTRVEVESDRTGYRAIFTGSGLSNPDNALTGTMTSLEVRDENGNTVAVLSGFSWSFETFIEALAESFTGNEAPLDALLNQQNVITLDGSAATTGLDDPLSDLTTDTEQTGSPADDLLVGGAGDDTLEGGDGNDTLDGESGNDRLYGGAGSDELTGGAGSDYINPGSNDNYDFIEGSSGNDTIDFGDTEIGYYDLYYGDLDGNVAVTINGETNTGSVNKFGLGTDTLLDVAQVMDEDLTDGLAVYGSEGNDSFDVTLADGQWMSLRGNEGNDSYTVAGDGYVRLDYRNSDHGIVANLATGVISDDGFGDTDTVTGTLWELRGSDNDDSIIGSAADERFDLRGGNDTLDGGAGFDMLRYDRTGFSNVTVDLSLGIATVDWEGITYTHTISNIERVRGSNDDDVLIGDSNANRFEGRGGNDEMIGGGGSDTFQGSDGNDTIDGGNGVDHLWYDAQSGDATIVQNGAVWSITINGETDTVTNVEWVGFNDTAIELETAPAPTSIVGTPGFDILEGTSGNDWMDGLAANDFVDGLAGNDTIYGGQGNDSLLGRAGNDLIYGGDNHDNIALHEGNDIGYGGLGNDSMGGGDGNDQLYGGSGNDVIGGGTGDDYIDAGGDQDAASGGYGADTVLGGAGDDTLAGSFGNDSIDGGTGDDNIGGGAGRDTIIGFQGNDSIGAGDGDDLVYGGTGNDFLAGGDGDDTIFGGSDADTINAGAGDDVMTGGAGSSPFDGAADLFLFNSYTDGEVDTIRGFEDGTDMIRLSGVGPGALSITNVTGGAAVEIGNTGHVIFVEGMTAGTLTADDFIFV